MKDVMVSRPAHCRAQTVLSPTQAFAGRQGQTGPSTHQLSSLLQPDGSFCRAILQHKHQCIFLHFLLHLRCPSSDPVGIQLC